MRLILGALAQSVLIDRVSNRMSILNVIERIQAPNFPLFVPEVAFVALLAKDSDDGDRSVFTITAHLGDLEILRFEMQGDFQGKPETRLVLNIQGLPVVTAQEIQFRISYDRGEIGVVKVPVEQSTTANIVGAT